MITKKDFIDLQYLEDLTEEEIKKLEPIIEDGFKAFENLHYIDEGYMEGEFNGLILYAKKINNNEWYLRDNRGGYLDCFISSDDDNKFYDHLEDVYDETREEYIKETEEMERTYRMLSQFR